MDPLQWMGAIRMRVQTADKNITIIHTTPKLQVYDKQIHFFFQTTAYSKNTIVSNP